MPRSSAASSTSFSSTGMPALANTIAMPPPMVPEPTTATRFTGSTRSFLGNVGNLRHLALAEENMDERLRLIGEKAFGEKFRFGLATFFERTVRSPASTASIAASGAFSPRCFLRAASRAAAKIAAFSAAVPSFSLARAFSARACRRFRAQRDSARRAGLPRSNDRSARARQPHARRPACLRRTSRLLWRRPTRRGRRCVPAAPGIIPSFTSGWPTCAVGDATR